MGREVFHANQIFDERHPSGKYECPACGHAQYAESPIQCPQGCGRMKLADTRR